MSRPRRLLRGSAPVYKSPLTKQSEQDFRGPRDQDFRDFAESASLALHFLGPDGVILWANQAELKMLGYSREEYLGRNIAEFHASDEAIADILDRLKKGERLREYEASLRTKHGAIRNVLIDSSVLFDGGKFVHTRCFTRDITENKQIQEVLRQSQERLSAIVDTTPECVKVVAAEGTVLHMNPAGVAMLEADGAGSVVGKSVFDFIAPEDRARFQQFHESICRGERGSLRFTILGMKGARRQVETRAAPLRNDDGSVAQLAITRDMTEGLLAEQALRENEQLLRMVTDASPVMVWMSGTDKLCFYFNKTWLDFVGRTLQYKQGNGWAENVHPDDFDRCLEIYNTCFDVQQPFEMQYRLRHHSGQYRWILDRGVPRFTADGMFEGFVGGCLDINDQREGAEKVKAALLSSQKLAAIVESSEDAIISKDLKGIVVSWNGAAERIFGYSAEEMIGRSITTIIPPELQDDEPRILATIARGERIEHFETVRVTKAGQRVEVSLTISPVRDETGKIIGAAKIARDITQQNKAEQALRTSERLATVGRLAATVAHEINNPLEALTNLVYLARQGAVLPEIRNYLAGAEEELGRISLLTRQTLGFYRETRGVVR